MDGAASFFTNGDRLDQRVQLHHVRDQPPAAQGPGVRRWGSASVRGGSASLQEGGPRRGGQQHRGAAHMSQQQVVVSQISRLVNLRHGGSPVEATFRARCTLAARTLAPLHTRLTPTGLASPQMRAWAWAQPADTRAARGVAVRKVQQAERRVCAPSVGFHSWAEERADGRKDPQQNVDHRAGDDGPHLRRATRVR